MTDPHIPLKAQSSRLGTLLEGATFKVPEFQRPYAWQAEQIDDFWDDVSEASRNGLFPHFFGTILTAAPDHPLTGNALDVLDGQQRLTTFTLLLIVLDRHFEELDSVDAAKSIRDAAAKSRERIRRLLLIEDRRRLKLRPDDDHFLANLVAGNPGSSTGSGTLGRAFARLHDYVARRLETSENHVGDLVRLTDAVLDRSVLIHAHCEAGFDSFVVFSTLNATGLRLTATQILRARTLGLVDNLPSAVGEETKDAWNAVEQLGDDGDRFLQSFLVLRTGERIQEKDVVRKFDQKILRLKSDTTAAEREAHFASLARELKALVPIYESLSAGAWPSTHPIPDEWRANRLSLLMKTLKLRQLLPLMMAAAKRDSLNFAQVVDVLERVSFVALVCFDNQTRWGDRTFQLAASVYDTDVSFEALLESIQDFFKLQLINPPERLRARLPEKLRYQGNRRTLIRYFLTTVNDWGFPEGPPTAEPDIAAAWVLRDVHIDHISAQNGVDTLSKLDRDRLGNLTPLKGKQNSALSNKPFDQKTAIYGTSPFRITRALKDVGEWTAEAVADRETTMVEFAVELFCRELPPLIETTAG